MREIHISIDQLIHQVASMLEKAGVTYSAARQTADLLVLADCRGIATHGVARVASYIEMLQNGSVNAAPEPAWTEVAPGIFRLQGDNGLGQVIGMLAMNRLIEHATGHGIALGIVENCGHLGAIGLYALQAARVNMMAFVAQATFPVMVPPGGTRPAIGNNPLAFAAPLTEDTPLVFDMSCSIAARGNVLLAARAGEPIPAGWAVDNQGKPTTDAASALLGGMLPVGAYKGIGLAMMVQYLAGILPGVDVHQSLTVAHAPPEMPASARPHAGAFMFVLNASQIVGDEHTLHARLLTWWHAYTKASGEASRFPGQEAARLERVARADGVSVRVEVLDELRQGSMRLGVPWIVSATDAS